MVCGPDVERELFLATVGGMGLTALIVEVTFRLQPVETPWMVVETEALRDLGAMLEGLEASALRLAVYRGLDRLPRARPAISGGAS